MQVLSSSCKSCQFQRTSDPEERIPKGTFTKWHQRWKVRSWRYGLWVGYWQVHNHGERQGKWNILTWCLWRHDGQLKASDWARQNFGEDERSLRSTPRTCSQWRTSVRTLPCLQYSTEWKLFNTNSTICICYTHIWCIYISAIAASNEDHFMWEDHLFHEPFGQANSRAYAHNKNGQKVLSCWGVARELANLYSQIYKKCMLANFKFIYIFEYF
jgi:hypothetical protein